MTQALTILGESSAGAAAAAASTHRSRRLFTLAMLCGVCTLIVMFGYLLSSGFAEAELGAEINTVNLARMIDAKTSDMMRRADSEIGDVISDIQIDEQGRISIVGGPGGRRGNVNLDTRLNDFPELAGIAVYDADGIRRFASYGLPGTGRSIAATDYFRQMKAVASDTLGFANSGFDRNAGVPYLDMARPIRGQDGTLQGVVVAELDMASARTFLDSLDLGKLGDVAIRNSQDFGLVLRRNTGSAGREGPMAEGHPVRRLISDGTGETTLKITQNGRARIEALRPLQDYPFFVAIWLDRGEVLAGWYRRALGMGIGGIVVLTAIGLLFLRMRRSEDKEELADAQIEHLALHDALTGLPNRINLVNRLDHAIAQSTRDTKRLAVVFIDLDRFKQINDTLGHAVGDGLLKEVAGRLERAVRNTDIVARLGGDEFVVVLSDLPSTDMAGIQAQRILSAVGEPYEIDGHELSTTPSLGIGMFPEDGTDVETLMKNADAAMYHAKAEGRNRFKFFAASMNQAANERMEMERDLRLALVRGEFLLHYQPQIETLTGKPVSFEALVRWKHPVRGMVSPADFIPLCEEIGLIVELGEWVLREALRQLAVWRAAGLPVRRVAVNLSADQLHGNEFQLIVEDALAQAGLMPGDLELEVTESVAMQDPTHTISILHGLRALGVELAMDDFGTGYSSLSYLKMMPIHRLKLDQSFVRGIETDASDAAICAGTIALAHKLGLEVVTEGTETAEQVEHIRRIGGDIVQGYFFSKPLPADAAGRYFAAAYEVEMAAA